ERRQAGGIHGVIKDITDNPLLMSSVIEDREWEPLMQSFYGSKPAWMSERSHTDGDDRCPHLNVASTPGKQAAPTPSPSAASPHPPFASAPAQAARKPQSSNSVGAGKPPYRKPGKVGSLDILHGKVNARKGGPIQIQRPKRPESHPTTKKRPAFH
ncbi:hypothetical protein CYMTET_8270, partial [Cymbomonas tetramitiformis]